MDEKTSGQIWTRWYHHSGAQVSFTIDAETDIRRLLNKTHELIEMLQADGFSMTEPGLTPDDTREIVEVVMRREKPADGTPIIDFFPPWWIGDNGTFGYFKLHSEYLDSPGEIDAFLKASGLKSLDEIPLYNGQVALKRTTNKAHACEKRVASFAIVTRANGRKIEVDGKEYEDKDLVRYERPDKTIIAPVVKAKRGEVPMVAPSDLDRKTSVVKSNDWHKKPKEFWSAYYAAGFQAPQMKAVLQRVFGVDEIRYIPLSIDEAIAKIQASAQQSA